MPDWLKTPATGSFAGALLILLGGIVYVAGSGTAGTAIAIVGFGLILKYRILPARREREEKR